MRLGKGIPLVVIFGIISIICGMVGFGIQGGSSGDDRFQTVTVNHGKIESVVTALGTLQPHSYVDVGAQVSGQITALHVEVGTAVTKGQLLAEIDPRVPQAVVDAGRAALASLRAQLQDQQAQCDLARLQLARQQHMIRDGFTKKEDLEIAEATLKSAVARIDALKAQITQTASTLQGDEAQLGYTRIYAPMAGTVISIDTKLGQTLNATYQTPTLLRIADLSAMTVWTAVSEADVRRVKKNMPVYFTTLGAEGREWHSIVRQILPSPPKENSLMSEGSESGSASVNNKVVVYTTLFDIDNYDGELMPQMTAQVSFVVSAAYDVIVAPIQALSATNGKSHLYTARVLTADGEVETREIVLGVRDRLNAEIISGLAVGDHLVTGENPAEPERWKFVL